MKNEQNQYVLMKAFNEDQLDKFFINSIINQLKNIIKPYDIIDSPDMYFIIGACNPQDNILLRFKDDSYFPKKLDALINGKTKLKYILREKDIKIDIAKFNQSCINAFNFFFKQKNQKRCKFDKNVVFITHKILDCYSIFKALQFIFGKNNCVNLQKLLFKNMNSPIIAVNDLIDKYIHSKYAVNKDISFKHAIDDVKQFVLLMTHADDFQK